MGISAVTFDYWNTLIKETPAPGELRSRFWADRLRVAGHETDGGTLESAFKHAWSCFEVRWRDNVQSTSVEMAADALAYLDLGLSRKVENDLAELFLEASLSTPRELLPGVEETFDRLRGLGLRVGIVSDVGGVPSTQMRRWLDELGVEHLVNHASFSDEVGAFKPSREIFEHALAGLGVSDPSEAAHVGDLRRTDVLGANRMGIVSVQYTGGRHDDEVDPSAESTPDHVVENHLDLLSMLDLD